jgi:invasion protein IalB
MLTDGVMMNIDNRQRFAFQVRYCTGDGCFAYLDLPRSVLDSMRRGLTANITFRTLDKQDITLPVSLKGFGGALQALQ